MAGVRMTPACPLKIVLPIHNPNCVSRHAHPVPLSFSFCCSELRWLTFRKKKNSETEKLRVSLLFFRNEVNDKVR
jgi:hypothetical protein